MEILIGIILLVGLGTLIGHGIWVATAWVLRGGKPKQSRAGLEPTLNDDRAAVTRYLAHLEEYELIDADTRAHWLRLVAKEARESLNARTPFMVPPKPASVASPQAKVLNEPDEEIVVELWPSIPAPPPIVAKPVFTPAASEKKDAFERLVAARSTPEPAFVAAPAAPPMPPPEPRRPLSEVLAGFMAEKNIRWGELIGGLLIICCSTALVISLWSRIESIPILKFIIFTVVTSALAGAGLFIHHRWKLPTTGHAILVISTMLVPLNLLAFAAFSSAGELGGGKVIGLEAVAIGLFSWLTFLAGRVVLPKIAGLMALGVMLLSVMSPAIRFWSPTGGLTLLIAASIPVAAYALVIAMSWFRHVSNKEIEDDDARRILLQLGILTFACLAPLGLLCYQAGNIVVTLRMLSPVLCAMAGPALVIGLLLWRRFPANLTAAHRTTAAAIALVAAAVMLLGAAVAWPMPSRFVPALAVNALALSGLAWQSRRPGAHGAAASALALIFVILVQIAFGSLGWSETDSWHVANTLLSALSGLALIVPVAACTLAATWLRQRDRYVLSRGYAVTSLALYVASAALLTLFGFGRMSDQHPVVWSYAVWGYAALTSIGLFAGWRLRLSAAGWCACGSLLLLTLQIFVFRRPDAIQPWPTAFLAYSTFCIACGALLSVMRSAAELRKTFGPALSWFGGVASVAVLGWTIHGFDVSELTPIALRIGWLAGLWLALAVSGRSQAVFFAGQMALYAAVALGMHGYLRGLDWYGSTGAAIGEPRVWQRHLLAAGLLSVLWGTMRWFASRAAKIEKAVEGEETADLRPLNLIASLLKPIYPAADQLVSGVVLMALGVLAMWGVWPVTAIEHGWQDVVMPFRLSEHAAGAGTWLVAAVVLATLALRSMEGQRREVTISAVLLVAFLTALVAAQFESSHHVATAWRLLSAIAFLLASMPSWWQRTRGVIFGGDQKGAMLTGTVHWFSAVLFVLPALALTVTAAYSAVHGQTGMGAPVSDIGLRFWLLAPLLPIVLALLGDGAARSNTNYAIMMILLAAAACVCTELAVAERAASMQSPVTLTPIWLIQLTAMVSAGGALVWYLVMNALHRDRAVTRMPAWPLLAYRLGFALILLWAGAWIWIRPDLVSQGIATIGGLWGITSIVAIEAALVLACRRRTRPAENFDATVWIFFVTAIIACVCERWDTGNWLCFHVMMIGLSLAAAARLAAGIYYERRLVGPGWQETFDTAAATSAGGETTSLPHDLTCVKCGYNLRGQETVGRCPECNTEVTHSRDAAMSRLTPAWAGALSQLRIHSASAGILFVLLAAAFAVRGTIEDPQRPWWSLGVLIYLAAPCFGLAVWRMRRGWAYAGAVQWCLAASVCWWEFLRPASFSATLAEIGRLVNVNILALSLAGLAWLFTERHFWRARMPAKTMSFFPALHQFGAIITSGAVLFLSVISVLGVAMGDAFSKLPVDSTSWAAWAAATALMAACAIWRALPNATAGLYALGLALIGLLTARFGAKADMLPWLLSLEFAGYALITAIIWRAIRAKLARDDAAPDWLVTANGALYLASALLALFVSWRHADQSVRLLVAIGPILAGIGSWLTAPPARRALQQTVSLHFFAASALLFSWAWIDPNAFFQRSVATACATAVMTLLAGMATMRLGAAAEFTSAIRRCLMTVSVVGMAAIAYCSTENVLMLMNHIKPETLTAQVVALLAAVGLYMACCVLFALKDSLDPLRLSAGAKGAYIYAAEVFAAVLGLHVRASMPWLFSGTITQYWPLLVMGLAFAAMGVGELCERRGLVVLSKPLGRTGTFLPALAMLDLFIAASVVNFSIVLLTAGAFYAVSAALRKSVLFAMVASALFTASLWYFLHHTPGLDITRHPQLWFIPPALAVLAAGHFNRARLTESQLRSLNFACLIAVYVSSAADVFLIGVAKAPWLPLVLGGLSVAGVLVGIAFRIRSFLQMGTAFLCLALFTIIWYAAEDLGWTWVWYVAGIALGILIITMFALFEKKRAEMTALMKGVREWKG